MDYGEKGLLDTLNVLTENSIKYVGAGKKNDSIGICQLEREGIKVAVVNVCENEWSTQLFGQHHAYGVNPVDNFNLIRKAKAKADKVIVIHHGGHEMYELPSPRMKNLFRFYVDSGADAVINHHTHCASGYEVYNDAPIFYSLGNFIFDNPTQKNEIWNTGFAVTLHLEKDQTEVKFTLHPYHQFKDKPQIEELINSEVDDFYKNIKLKNQIIYNDQLLEKEFLTYCNEKRRMYNSYIEPVKNRLFLFLRNRGLFPSLWSKRKKLYLQNLVRCESHRDVLLNILYDENSHTP